MRALNDALRRRALAVRVRHDDVCLMVHDEQRVGIVDDVLVDRDAVEVLLEDGTQVAVLVSKAITLALDAIDVRVLARKFVARVRGC